MKTTVLTLNLLMICTLAYTQNTITVDNNPGTIEVPNLIYTDLQEAIDAAQTNDTLYIQPSVISYGDVTINKALHVIGRSHSENNQESKIDEIELQPNSSNSTFSGLYIQNRIYLYNTQPTSNLVFTNNYIDKFMVSSVSGQENGMNNSFVTGNVIGSLGGTCSGCTYFLNTSFTNNIFLSDQIRFQYTNNPFSNNIIVIASNDSNLSFYNHAYNATTNPTNMVIENCILIKPQGSVAVTGIEDGIQFNNCLSYNAQSTFEDLPGNNNLNDQNPMFVNVTNNIFEAYTDDYHLQAGSPASAAGTDGEDIGIYNTSGYLFNMFGYTYGIPSVNITAITETVQEGQPLEVTISTNSN